MIGSGFKKNTCRWLWSNMNHKSNASLKSIRSVYYMHLPGVFKRKDFFCAILENKLYSIKNLFQGPQCTKSLQITIYIPYCAANHFPKPRPTFFLFSLHYYFPFSYYYHSFVLLYSNFQAQGESNCLQTLAL